MSAFMRSSDRQQQVTNGKKHGFYKLPTVTSDLELAVDDDVLDDASDLSQQDFDVKYAPDLDDMSTQAGTEPPSPAGVEMRKPVVKRTVDASLALGQNAEKTPASAALTPAKAKTSEGQSSAMIGGAFIQGEAAEIYSNPPANYQMYPRNSPTVVEENKPQDLGTVGAWDLEEAEEWEVKKVHQRQESKSTVASDSDMLLAAP